MVFVRMFMQCPLLIFLLWCVHFNSNNISGFVLDQVIFLWIPFFKRATVVLSCFLSLLITEIHGDQSLI